jgi:hypothetical protein
VRTRITPDPANDEVSDMSAEVTTTLDGFDGFEDRIEGEEQEQSFGRVIQGEKWKFTMDGKWMDNAEEEISPEREITVVDIARVLQKWKDGMPVETRFIAPGERIPDVERLNAECPKSEWGEDRNGNPCGPWRFQYVLYGVDATMAKISYPTDTIGGGMCIRELADQVALMRKFRSQKVYPVVAPSHKWMNTKYGGRNRPHFMIKRWIAFGPDGAMLPEPSTPPARTLSNSTASVQPEALKDLPSARTVPEVSVAEELNDKIPF